MLKVKNSEISENKEIHKSTRIIIGGKGFYINKHLQAYINRNVSVAKKGYTVK